VWDRVLWETEDFICVPTKGSIVAGWVLIIPRRSALSFGQLSPEARHAGGRLARSVEEKLKDKFGPVAWFEHGPLCEGSPVGCTVDHAHLHLVPISTDLLSGARALLGANVVWAPVDGLDATAAAFAQRQDYLYLRQNGREWLGTGTIGSQIFRRVIATATGCADQYDWRKHAFESNVRVTLRAFSQTLVSVAA
jgi:ATP adenylyltransferase